MKSLLKRVAALESRLKAIRVIPPVVIQREGETPDSALHRHFEIHGQPEKDFFYILAPEQPESIGDYDDQLERYQNGN